MKGGALWIAWKSLQQHALSTWISAASIALAGGLLMTVWVLRTETRNTFTDSHCGFDGVLGPKGSQLQLVLNSIFHMESSPGTIPGNSAQVLQRELMRYPQTRGAFKRAYPIMVGDNFMGYRLVGTTADLFKEHELSEGKKFQLTGEGDWFAEDKKEAVVGSFAAHKLGLKVGDSFHAYHGLVFSEEARHDDLFTVTGILEPTSTPVDRVIWIPLSGYQDMEGHDKQFASDVSALLVKLSSPIAVPMVELMVNKRGKEYTFAPVVPVLGRFFDKFGWFIKVLELVAYLVGISATGSILAILYNILNEKRREIAILRSLGARRGTLVSVVIYQSVGIAFLGVLLSFVFFAIVASVASDLIREQTGVVLDLFQYQPVFVWVPANMLALGFISGILPAVVAYSTEVSRNLAPTS